MGEICLPRFDCSTTIAAPFFLHANKGIEYVTSEYRLIFNEVALRCWSYFNFLCRGIGVQVEKNDYFLSLFWGGERVLMHLLL